MFATSCIRYRANKCVFGSHFSRRYQPNLCQQTIFVPILCYYLRFSTRSKTLAINRFNMSPSYGANTGSPASDPNNLAFIWYVRRCDTSLRRSDASECQTPALCDPYALSIAVLSTHYPLTFNLCDV